MTYILQKDSYFCFLDGKNAVCKTQNINLAKRFNTQGEARAMLNKATKKLKNYKIVELETLRQVGDINRIKRKQFSSSERTIIYNKNKGRCAICGKFIPYDNFTIDHIIPLVKGGTNELSNLQPACNVCNFIKQDFLPEDLKNKLLEIILYQMRIDYDDSVWKKINYIRWKRRKLKVTSLLKLLQKWYQDNRWKK